MTTIREYPIFLQNNELQYHYMINQENKDWKIKPEKQHSYNIWKPNVKPTPEGEVIDQVVQIPYKKNKAFFNVYDAKKEKKPEDLPWKLSEPNGTLYDLNLISDSHNKSVLIYEENGKFNLVLLDSQLKMVKYFDQEADKCEDNMINSRKSQNSRAIKSIIKKENELKKKDPIIDDNFQDISEDDEPKVDTVKKGSDSDADLDIKRSDDSEIGSDDINISDLESSDIGDYEEDEPQKGEQVKPKPQEAVIQNEIINDLLPKEKIKLEEFVRYFQETGLATLPSLFKRFKDKIGTKEQKAAFYSLIKENCKKTNKGDIEYFQLKPKKK